LIFTDQLSDPRPGFADINIDAFESHLSGNVKTFIISSPQALAQFGSPDSTGFIDTQTNVTGVGVDINSSDDILDKLRLITSEKGIPDFIQPQAKWPITKIMLIAVPGLLLIIIPLLFQIIRQRSILKIQNTKSWKISVDNDFSSAMEFPIYTDQKLTIGSTATIKITSLPPIAAEFSLSQNRPTIKPFVNVEVNGNPVKKSMILRDGDKISIEGTQLTIKCVE
jgi:hypothetical protein